MCSILPVPTVAEGKTIVSTAESSEQIAPEERARLRKQMSEQAVKLAVSSRWEEAAALNRDYVRIFGDESEVLNRLGKSLTELGQVTEARKAYARAYELDPTNTIAKRMLDKLVGVKDSAAAAASSSQLNTSLFIAETGKATVASIQALDQERKRTMDAGDVVELKVAGSAVNVETRAGDYVGMVEPKVGMRLARMMTAGNQYSAALVSVTPALRVMIRETYQHPSMHGRVSFPQAKATSVRGFTRRGLLRGNEEGEYPDEDGDDTETDDWTDLDSDINEESHGNNSGVHVEQDDESYD